MLFIPHRRKLRHLRNLQPIVLAFMGAGVLFGCKNAPNSTDVPHAEEAQLLVAEAEECPLDARPAVEIDGRTILTSGELNQRLELLTTRYKDTPGTPMITPAWLDARRDTLIAAAIENHLLQMYLQENGIPLPSKAETLERLIAFNPLIFDNKEIFERYLVSRSISRDDYLSKRQREFALADQLEELGRLEISDEELDQYYRTQRDRLRARERILVSTITLLLPADASPELVEQRRLQLEDLRENILSETITFEEACTQRSQGVERAQSGDLGWVQRGEEPTWIAANIERTLFQTDVDTITPPIRTIAGIQLFWVRDKRRAGVRAIDEVRDSMEQPLRSRRLRALRRDIINELRERHDVVEHEEVIGYELRDETQTDDIEAED